MKLEELILIPLKECLPGSSHPKGLTAAHNDEFWLVTDNDEIMFYTRDKGNNIYPQSNVNRLVYEKILEKIEYPLNVRIVHIPLLFRRKSNERRYWRNMYETNNAAKICSDEVSSFKPGL